MQVQLFLSHSDPKLHSNISLHDLSATTRMDSSPMVTSSIAVIHELSKHHNIMESNECSYILFSINDFFHDNCF